MKNEKANEVLDAIMSHIDPKVAEGIQIAKKIYELEDAGADMKKVKDHVEKKTLTKRNPSTRRRSVRSAERCLSRDMAHRNVVILA